MSTLGRMIAINAAAFEKKTDMGGNPYILHPIRIMIRVTEHGEEVMIIAVGHDLVEDNPDWTLDRLYKEGFSERVIAALRVLTHDPKDSYEDYIKKVATNRDAIIVKLEDLRDNSDITRLKGIKAKDIARIEKYHKAYTFLKAALKAMDEIYGI